MIIPVEIEYILNVDSPGSFSSLAKNINDDADIRIVMIQHEFGFFEKKEDEFVQFLRDLTKSIIIAFHTVLPNPNELLKENVQEISGLAESIIVSDKLFSGNINQRLWDSAGKDHGYSSWHSPDTSSRTNAF